MSAAMFILSIYGGCTQKQEASDSSQKYESLREQVSEAVEKEEINSTEATSDALNDTEVEISQEEPIQEADEPVILNKYAELYKQNNDLVGWISNGDSIDYPIMRNLSDSNFYLHKAFDKTESKAGSLYIPNDISIDDSMVLIYGHHMRDSSMFGSLKNYLDEEYLQDHPTIYFSNLYEEIELQVLGVFISKVYPDDYTGFEYYNYRGNITEEQFNEYIAGITPLMQIGDLNGVSHGDRLIELSTCWYSEDNARLVLICKAE